MKPAVHKKACDEQRDTNSPEGTLRFEIIEDHPIDSEDLAAIARMIAAWLFQQGEEMSAEEHAED